MTPAPTWGWDAHVSDIFTKTVVFVLITPASILAVVYLVLRSKGRSDLVDLFGGAIICVHDVTSDWILIVDWYLSGNIAWASWILASVLLGGQISAEALRQRDEEERGENCEPTSCRVVLRNYFIDLIGFSVLRAFPREYALRKEYGDEKSLPITKRETTSIGKKLHDLSFCVHIGGVVESLISFAMVSYYIISGTVAFHIDVKRPDDFTYLAWIFSYLGIIYKMLTFDHYESYFESKDKIKSEDFESKDKIESEVPSGNSWWKILHMSKSILSVCFMLFLCVLPASINAQFDNGVILGIFPEALSKKIALSYIVPIIILISVWTRRFCWIEEKDLDFGGVPVGKICFVLVNVSSIWLLITQIFIQFEGRFRTPLGETLCWFWTISAIIILPEIVVQLPRKKSDNTKAQQNENADIQADHSHLEIPRVT